MGITSRKKRPIDRERVDFKDSRLFIIATEGELTEPRYFKMFRASRIQIEVLPTENGESSPQAVFERLKKYEADFNLNEEDKLFLVIDVDRWPAKNMADVAKRCAENANYVLAVSNSCFEVWICLHFFNDVTKFGSFQSCEALLRETHGSYNKNNLSIDWFNRENIKQAVANAKALESNARDRWPQTTGSHVYKVIEEILDESKLPNE